LDKGKRGTWEEAVLWLRCQPDRAELVRACFFDDPLLSAAERYYRSTEWRAVQRLLPRSGGRALDMGAGRGISSYALARDGWTVVALEPDPSPIVGVGAIKRLANEGQVQIDVVETWGEELPFPDSAFDLVHCRQVMHHARDLNKFCSEIVRVLKPNGKLIATREHVISRDEDLKVFQDNHPLHFFYGGEMAYRLSQYTDAMIGSGLELSHIFNPLGSEINLFPETRAQLKARISKRLRIIPAALVPNWTLSWLGKGMEQPGRLYSFVGKKRANV
jgi:SAM-dependent methyltransferase